MYRQREICGVDLNGGVGARNHIDGIAKVLIYCYTEKKYFNEDLPTNVESLVYSFSAIWKSAERYDAVQISATRPPDPSSIVRKVKQF